MARMRRQHAASATGAENDDSTRSGALWTQREEMLLLRAWRDALREAVASGAELLNGARISTRVHRNFVDAGGSRSEKSIKSKRLKLQRTYRLIANCNGSPPEPLSSDQNESESDSSARSSASLRAPHKIRKKLTTTMRSSNTATRDSGNGWFAWTLAQQEAAFAARYGKAGFQEVTEEMFDVLEEIHELSGWSSSNERGTANSQSSWIMKELWLMLTAWRQVLETKSRQESLRICMYKRFVELVNEQGDDSLLPVRSMSSFLIKRRRLISLYKGISKFNKEGKETNGPHGSASTRRDWFKLSQKEKRDYLRDVLNVDCRFHDISQDFYNTMHTVMQHKNMREDGDGGGDVVAGSRHGSPEVIDIDSDSSHSDSSGWEILPHHPTIAYDTENTNRKSAETTKVHVSPSKRMRGTVTDESSSSESSDDDSDSSNSSSSSSESSATFQHAKKRKARKSNSDLANVAEFRLMWSQLQSEIGRERQEREATLAKIREERKSVRQERKKMATRIAEAAVEREEDKQERTRERQEWLREKERLENKLTKARAKYKKAALKLKRRAC